MFDLLLKNGQLLDPDRGARKSTDVGISGGKVAALEPDIPVSSAVRSMDLGGKLVLPGLVDLHTHVYWGATPLGVDPDKIGPASGVTTWVDAGSSGAGNVEGLVYHIVGRSPLRIAIFLNISYIGLSTMGMSIPFGETFDYRLADVRQCKKAMRQYQESVAGIKVRLGDSASGPNGVLPLRLAISVASEFGLPVMVHLGVPPPTLEEVLPLLRPGDIVTHCFNSNGTTITDGQGQVKDPVWQSRERGVIFDSGHGTGSFSFEVARTAISQGFLPDTISSDLHAYNVAGPVFDLPTTVSKFLQLGMTFEDAIRCVTSQPARVLGLHHETGSLMIGRVADIAVGHLGEGTFCLQDSYHVDCLCDRMLVIDYTIKDGQVVVPRQDDREESKLASYNLLTEEKKKWARSAGLSNAWSPLARARDLNQGEGRTE